MLEFWRLLYRSGLEATSFKLKYAGILDDVTPDIKDARVLFKLKYAGILKEDTFKEMQR